VGEPIQSQQGIDGLAGGIDRLADAAPPARKEKRKATKQGRRGKEEKEAWTRLHHEVAAFAAAAAPTEEEAGLVSSALQGVAAAATSVWPQSSVVLFGSQARSLPSRLLVPVFLMSFCLSVRPSDCQRLLPVDVLCQSNFSIVFFSAMH
jgi:hypothetical protein